MRIKPNSSGTSQSKQAAVLQAIASAARRQGKSCGDPRGFTLLEVMIVMVIMAVISAIAIPAFSSWREKQAVRNAAQTLLSQLKQARVLAMAENRTVSVKFGVDVNGGAANAYVFDLGKKNMLITYGQFSKHLIMRKKNSTSLPITLNFKSRGTVKASSVDICSSGYHKRITINLIGRARLCLSGDSKPPCSDPYQCP